MKIAHYVIICQKLFTLFLQAILLNTKRGRDL